MYVEAIHKDKEDHTKHSLMASECYPTGIETYFKFLHLDFCSHCTKGEYYGILAD